MQLKAKVFSFIFFIIFFIQIYAEYTNNENLRFFSKPLIVFVLLVWVYLSTGLKNSFHKSIFLGLIFAFTGDILLLMQADKPSFFMLGLIAFLLCHISYISAFMVDAKLDTAQKNPYFFWAIFFFLIFCAGLFFYLQPHLGSMEYPVLVYAIVISTMATMSVSRYGKVNNLSFITIFCGALFFLLSDSTLACNKFVKPLPEAGVIIMASYMLAQYLIVYGAIVRKLPVTKM